MPPEILTPDTQHPKRRASDHGPGDCPGGCEEILSVEQRLQAGDERMDRIEADVKETRDGVTELLDILHNAKGFFKSLGYIATALKWTAGLAAPLIGLWYVIKEGVHK